MAKITDSDNFLIGFFLCIVILLILILPSCYCLIIDYHAETAFTILIIGIILYRRYSRYKTKKQKGD